MCRLKSNVTIEYDVETIRTYYIVFDRKRHSLWYWWRIFTGTTFSHCYLLTEINDDSCIKIEPVLGGIDMQVVQVPIDQYITAYAHSGVTAILSYTVNSTNLHADVSRGIISCVSMVKAFLWLRKCRFAVTPFQLYKLLLKRGAIPIKPYTPYIKSSGG